MRPPASSHFYPRSPRGERLVGVGQRTKYCPISIHAPHEGSDQASHRSTRSRYISIHAPHEGSDGGYRYRSCEDILISIHAPHEGSDRIVGKTVGDPDHFYPRSPRGERLPFRKNLLPGNPISIHAPHEGSDGLGSPARRLLGRFLSTLPTRGATAKPNKNTAGFCAKGPNADLGCTKREGHFCAISMIFLRAGAVRRDFAGANLPVGPCALGLRTGGGRRPDYTSSTSSWDHCGARPMCSTRVL